jgi:AraC-like DNA-binding protein
MKYLKYSPPNALTNIVHQYWSLEGKVPEGQKYIHRTMANFYPELIFHYGGRFMELTDENNIETAFIAGIHGQTDKIRRFIPTDQYGIFGVLLQPYAIPLLFGISSSETCNQLIDLPSIFGAVGITLKEQMLEAKDNFTRVEIINRFLKKRLRNFKRPEIVNAAQLIYKKSGMVDVKQIAMQSFLSQRQFERNFKELIGFSPKSFARLVRFKSLINNYNREDKSLTQVAYDFGYYDQSHFIQEFKSFSGYKPNTYFSGGASEIFYAPSAK